MSNKAVSLMCFLLVIFLVAYAIVIESHWSIWGTAALCALGSASAILADYKSWGGITMALGLWMIDGRVTPAEKNITADRDAAYEEIDRLTKERGSISEMVDKIDELANRAIKQRDEAIGERDEATRDRDAFKEYFEALAGKHNRLRIRYAKLREQLKPKRKPAKKRRSKS